VWIQRRKGAYKRGRGSKSSTLLDAGSSAGVHSWMQVACNDTIEKNRGKRGNRMKSTNTRHNWFHRIYNRYISQEEI